VKQKWTILRDVFRRELKKHLYGIPRPDGQTVSYKSRWVYFSCMLFLKDVMQVSENTDEDESLASVFFVKNEDLEDTESKGGYPSDETHQFCLGAGTQGPLGVESRGSVHANSILESHNIETDDVLPENSSRTRKRSCSFQVQNELIGTKRHIVSDDACHHSGMDDDYHFLMSLLPFLRKAPESQKLKIRMRLIQAIQGETDSYT
jgi:Alcohol dehydrogenase transcription factor Myb/SANT-like./BESS motif.